MSTRQESLFRRLESSDRAQFSHAVFLSYGIDIAFFDETLLRTLRRRGCTNIAVFADAKHVSSAIKEVLQPGRHMQARFGREYSLTPVHHSYAFHPKIAMLIGEEIELWIGSGNLEPGGLVHNFEILNRLKCSTSDQRFDQERSERSVVTRAWRYLKNQVAKDAAQFVRAQLDEIEEDVPWLTEDYAMDGTVQLIVSPDDDAVIEMARAVGNTKVQTLLVVSAFFDAKLIALKRLISSLHPKRVVLIVQENTVSVSGQELKKLKDIELYRLRPAKRRYAHAKVVIAECQERSVMLSGSHNVSQPAMSGTENYEAGLLLISDAGNHFSEELALVDELVPENRIPLNEINFQVKPQYKTIGGTQRHWIVSAQYEDGAIELVIRKRLNEACLLVSYSWTGNELEVPGPGKLLEGKAVFEVGQAGEEWAAVAVRDKGETSAPAPLQHPEVIGRQTLPFSRSSRVRNGGQNLSLTELAGVLDEFSTLLIDLTELGRDRLSARSLGAKGKSPEKPEDPKQLRYEDFVVEWSPPSRTKRSATGSATGVDDFFDALARLTGGRFLPRVRVSNPDSFPNENRDLADEKLLEEEELAERRTKGDESGVLESDQDDERPEQEAPRDLAESTEDQLKAARRIAKRLDRFMKGFSEQIERNLGQASLSPRVIETLTAAGRLVTTMVGRQKEIKYDRVEFESWKQWADFHVGLLHLLSTSRIRLLLRLPTEKLSLVTNRQRMSELVAYLVVVYAISNASVIEPESRYRIQLGLLRVGRLLGIDQKKLQVEQFEEQVNEIIGAMYKPAVAETGIAIAVDHGLSDWAKFVSKFRTIDERLRKRFKGPAEVSEQHAGINTPSAGAWVWWANGQAQKNDQGHVAAALVLKNDNLGLVFEPLGEPIYVSPSYVVALD
jgi:hypothetical protein